MSAPMLELRNVSRRYAGTSAPAVEQVSLTVERGEVCAILGPSGAGKTTVLRLVAGFEDPDTGTISIDGNVVAAHGLSLPPEDRRVGVVFQHGALFPHLTVRRNVEFGISSRGAGDRAARWLEVAALCGLEKLGDRYPHELSGGEQQRVALARALAPELPLVLLDEPLSSVDPLQRESLGADLRRILKSTGTTALLVTHDQHEAFSLADRIVVLRNGLAEQVGNAAEVYRTPNNSFVASFVGHATFLQGRCRAGQVVTEIGSFADLRSHSDGTAVRVPIRPGDCVLEDMLQGDSLVESATFVGDHWVCNVRLPSGQLLRCDIDSAARGTLCAGTRVRVVPRISAAVTFAE